MKIHKPVKKSARTKEHPKKKLGYLHIYTGEGKGKTSAALGVLLRAAGQGHNVVMIQFLKGNKASGELLAYQKLGPNVEILQFGRDDLASLQELQTVDAYLATQGLQYARDIMQQRRPDVLILDELATAVYHRLIPVRDVIDFLDNRHRNTEVIVTGYKTHPALLNMADLVTVMQAAKHYFDYANFEPRLGIEV
ncbi:MAG: cob(I)yrinic acid a,c-diamide adenosyltransferase [uncultured bacterium]|nr:MAG: cob(I)yrinic acid a,c-diamide adenosyltransferase [uncultured bacterium]